jgi:radical SAM protein with 4Fe4S-binding SPASM domain
MELGMIAPEMFYKIVDEAKNHLPVCVVFFFRGESLLHPNIIDFISYAKKSGLSPLQIASNGLELTDEMADKLIQSGLDFISFSLDTNDDELYKKSRKYGNLEKSRQNVINFAKKCEARKKRGLTAPEIQVSTVDIEEYRSEQEDFINFWREYADKVRVYVEHSKDKNPGSLSENLLIKTKERKECKKVFTDMVIYWDGTVGLCNHDWFNDMKIGNANDSSIEKIWNSEKYQEVRKMHKENNFVENCVCKNCDHWQMYYLPEGFLGKIYEKCENNG